jgi:hypothetical protein
MAFTSDLAKLVSDQLSSFVTLNRHQLAGQVANLDFWIGEVRHALDVIEGYRQRFQRLKTAQSEHVTEHRTIEFDLSNPYPDESTPSPLRPTRDAELREVRRSLREAAYRFLVRCFIEELIDEATLRRACNALDIGIDRKDLKPRRQGGPTIQS